MKKYVGVIKFSFLSLQLRQLLQKHPLLKMFNSFINFNNFIKKGVFPGCGFLVNFAKFLSTHFFKEHAQTTFFEWAIHLENIPLSKICFEMINSAKT